MHRFFRNDAYADTKEVPDSVFVLGHGTLSSDIYNEMGKWTRAKVMRNVERCKLCHSFAVFATTNVYLF
jgi:hypothetical protein